MVYIPAACAKPCGSFQKQGKGLKLVICKMVRFVGFRSALTPKTGRNTRNTAFHSVWTLMAGAAVKPLNLQALNLAVQNQSCMKYHIIFQICGIFYGSEWILRYAPYQEASRMNGSIFEYIRFLFITRMSILTTVVRNLPGIQNPDLSFPRLSGRHSGATSLFARMEP